MVEDISAASADADVAPTMQTVWLVVDIDACVEGQPSKQDHLLDVQMTYAEWLAIYFDALSLDKAIYDDWIQNGPRVTEYGAYQIVAKFDEVIHGFPMLSRINEPYHDVVFTVHEIEDLREECLRVKASTCNRLATHGLEKLLTICDRASELRLTIYFVSQ
jgi:hypothetical protein